MRAFGIVLTTFLCLALSWASAALWFDGPASRALAGVLTGGFALASLALLLFVRPFRRALLVAAALFGAVLNWWLSIAPSNDRDWQPDVARLAQAVVDHDTLTIRNVRDFDYRSETDYTERWEERSYDLSKLDGVDMFLSYWGSPWIAHTITSWSFSDGQHLAISIETRKEKGESYSAVRGFFRQYELYYVVADERDVIRLRTNYRGEDVYLYHLRTSLPVARATLLDYVREINELAHEPTWYNAFSQNCTTTIRHHVQNVAPANPWNWRILVNGKIDELGYERGTIDTSLPFAELRRRSAISERAKAADPADFSRAIRVGLPGGSLAGAARYLHEPAARDRFQACWVDPLQEAGGGFARASTRSPPSTEGPCHRCASGGICFSSSAPPASRVRPSGPGRSSPCGSGTASRPWSEGLQVSVTVLSRDEAQKANDGMVSQLNRRGQNSLGSTKVA